MHDADPVRRMMGHLVRDNLLMCAVCAAIALAAAVAVIGTLGGLA